MSSCPFNPASQQYADFLYYYTNQSQPLPNSLLGTLCLEYASSYYAVVHVPLESSLPLSFEKYSYYSIPSLFTLLDTSSMEASGIQQVLNTPALANGGRGTIIGLADTGLDYTNPLFRNPDGTTRLLCLWDQTLPEDLSAIPPGVPDYFPNSGASYGTEFTEEEINRALASEDPYALVPSRDTEGHGTFLAGIAAGGFSPDGDFNGAAPNCRLAAVKLKPAKDYLRQFYLIRPEAPAYQENDIMMAIKYLYVTSLRFGMPLVILLGLGTNSGSHEGRSPLSSTLQSLIRFPGTISVAAAGNETGLGHHYRGGDGDGYEDVELYVGPQESAYGFSMEMWSAGTASYSISFISPGGERAGGPSPAAKGQARLSFSLVETQITVCEIPVEPNSGRQLFFIRFQKPAEGIWRIRVYADPRFPGEYNMWLPAEGFISPETRFLRPDPWSTITIPANSAAPLTIGAYNHTNDSIAIHSSRGYALNGQIKPDLTAPGVNVYGPAPAAAAGGAASYPMTRRSGTSVAAAHAAGAAASLLSWGMVEGNDVNISQASLRSYLIRGARRSPSLSYPNREWGYGVLDLYETFRLLR